MALKGVGTENKKRVYQLAALVVVMLGIAAWEIFGSSSTPTPTAPPAAPAVVTAPAPSTATETAQETTTTAAGAYVHQAAKVGGLAALDPTLHPEIMRQAESLEYTGKGRNIFSLTSMPTAIPKPVASVRQVVVETGPPPPPPPPPITLGFYGYASEKSGQKQVFLLHGDDIFIASEGDVVDRRYRVVKIGPASIQVEDIPYHNTQTLPLRQ
jgi:hypothetical protein